MTLGVAWYTPETWSRLSAVADDRDMLGTFEAWQRKVERSIDRYAAHGIAVEKVLLDIDEMARWCRREGYRVDQVGRTAYGAFLLATIGKTAGRA